MTRQAWRRMQLPPVGVEFHRGDQVESLHRVHVTVADADGHVMGAIGDANFVTFLRSAAKPLQAAALVASGAADAFGVTEAELAVACGSHAGEAAHVAAAAAMLAKAGLAASALQCGTHKFWNAEAKKAVGGQATPLHNNCSGKHAGMLLLQRHLGGDAADYLDPASPAQQRILALVKEVSGVDDVGVAVDGCGAPTFAMPLVAAARCFARLAMPRGVSKETADALRRVARAMAMHPEMVGGTARFDTDLMGASEDRLVSKAGAEGFQAVGDMATGLGLALKVEDGATRAVAPATVEALRQLAWLEGRAFEVLGEWWLPSVKNHAGRAVGRGKPVLVLTHEP